jgi:transposase
VRATCKKPFGRSTAPQLQDLHMGELEDIVERASKALPDGDGMKLRASIETLAWLQQELAKKNVDLARLRSLFGLSTTEKTDKVLGEQVDDESVDDEGDASRADTGSSESKKKPKVKGHGRNKADAYVGAERVEVEHDELRSGDPCPECPKTKRGRVYTLKKPRTLVRVTGQAPLHATVYELQTLRCNLCGTVFAAKPPPGVGDKKYDATAASMIALLKYGSGLPFNRLEQLEGHLGIPLPAATQWDIVSGAAEELTPVLEELIRQAAQGRLVHNDDTSMRVLDLRKEIDELEQSGQTDRTGIFSTSIVSELAEGRRIALYFTGRQHAGENMADVLHQRAAALGKPMQMCDGLDHNLPKDFETVVANCLAHARRKFVEVVNSFPDECRHVLESLRDVYQHDAKARKDGLDDDQRLSYHQEHSAPVLDELRTWMDQQIDEKLVEPNSPLGKAIAYMTKRWDRLTLFLREPGAPLDNNLAERALKKAILHRKNALFYKTLNGARVGDLFMTLIHTAELAGENPFDYLAAVLNRADRARRDPADWLPWSYAAAIADANRSGGGPA